MALKPMKEAFPDAPSANPVLGDMYRDPATNDVMAYDGAIWRKAKGKTINNLGTTIDLSDGDHIRIGGGASNLHWGSNTNITMPYRQIKPEDHLLPSDPDVCIERISYSQYCKAPLQTREQKEHRRCENHIWEFDEAFSKSEREWIMSGNKDFRVAIIGLVRHVKDLESTVIELQNRLEEIEQ